MQRQLSLGPVLIDITPQHSHHATTFSRCGNDHGFGKVRPRARQHSDKSPVINKRDVYGSAQPSRHWRCSRAVCSATKTVRHALWIGAAAGMAPDLDVLIQSSTDPLLALEYHRQFTHSLLFVPIGALLCAAMLYPIVRKQLSFRKVWLFASAGLWHPRPARYLHNVRHPVAMAVNRHAVRLAQRIGH